MACNMFSSAFYLNVVVYYGVFYLSAVVYFGHAGAVVHLNTIQALGLQIRRNVRPEDGELNIMVTFVDKSFEHCIGECRKRSACKAVEYKRLVNWCRLRSNISTVVTSKGFLTVTGFNGTGTCGSKTCSSGESCNETTRLCSITECGSPDIGHKTRGNRFEVGSKVVRSCVDDIQQLTCTNAGEWEESYISTAYSELTCVGLRRRDPDVRSGVYKNRLDMQIYCEFDTDGESWMVFQRRMNGSENFLRTWDEYKSGFGNKSGEFWFGLEHVYQIIRSSCRQFRLRIDMEDWEGNTKYAVYEDFYITDESDGYRLHCGMYSGTAGDALRDTRYLHNGQRFTTIDRDNDKYASGNCALRFKGAWWYEDCHRANLNGKYYEYGDVPKRAEGLVWQPWTGYTISLRKTTMKMQETFMSP